METITAKTPWEPFMGQVPMHLDYFQGTMFEAVEKIAREHPDFTAFTFMGKATSYRTLIEETERCARALRAVGVKEGDKLTIAMPNCPQAIYMFYGVNRVGAIANMIHPLSAEKEIEFYLNVSDSRIAITLDQFYGKFASILANTGVETLIIATIKDALSPLMKIGYQLTQGRKIAKVPADAPKVLLWKNFLKKAKDFSGSPAVKRAAEDPAVILYSGGTTGTTKGIVLMFFNFTFP